jgi:hypothetical protein
MFCLNVGQPCSALKSVSHVLPLKSVSHVLPKNAIMAAAKIFSVKAGTSVGLYHPLDGVINPKYKLLHFLTTKNKFCREEKALAFNWDRCCHLAVFL